MKENLLRAKIVERGHTIDSFCKEAKFVRSTFDRKLTGQTAFTRDEIVTISLTLSLTNEEFTSIFFPECVAQNCNK